MGNIPALTERLGIRHPIIQAPMAGVSTATLAAAVSNAGGLGSLGVGAMSVHEAANLIRETKELTDRPFNVNLFVNARARSQPAKESRWLDTLAPEFRRFGAEPPISLREIYETSLDNDAMLAMLLKERPAVVSFHFGLPTEDWITALRRADIVTMATATNLDEALQVERAGIDAVVAQGYEAGGHRGTFDPTQDEEIGTLALVRLLASRIAIPVIAAGGIMDGNGVSAAFKLGAAGAQLGTAFILCPESSASEAYRNILKSDRALHTAVTSNISGRPARGIVNRFHEFTGEVPDYPIAYDAGKALHRAAAAQGNHEYAAHWAGQAAYLARELPAAEMLEKIVTEWHESEFQRDDEVALLPR
jgi:nitronate monooxygenase